MIANVFRSVKIEDVAFLKEYLKNGGDPNVRDLTARQSSALHWAAFLGSVSGAKLLIEHGADINITEVNGLTPLHLAAQEGHEKVVQYLLQNNADYKIKSVTGCTALDRARTAGRQHIGHLLVATQEENKTHEESTSPELFCSTLKIDTQSDEPSPVNAKQCGAPPYLSEENLLDVKISTRVTSTRGHRLETSQVSPPSIRQLGEIYGDDWLDPASRESRKNSVNTVSILSDSDETTTVTADAVDIPKAFRHQSMDASKENVMPQNPILNSSETVEKQPEPSEPEAALFASAETSKRLEYPKTIQYRDPVPVHRGRDLFHVTDNPSAMRPASSSRAENLYELNFLSQPPHSKNNQEDAAMGKLDCPAKDHVIELPEDRPHPTPFLPKDDAKPEDKTNSPSLSSNRVATGSNELDTTTASAIAEKISNPSITKGITAPRKNRSRAASNLSQPDSSTAPLQPANPCVPADGNLPGCAKPLTDSIRIPTPRWNLKKDPGETGPADTGRRLEPTPLSSWNFPNRSVATQECATQDTLKPPAQLNPTGVRNVYTRESTVQNCVATDSRHHGQHSDCTTTTKAGEGNQNEIAKRKIRRSEKLARRAQKAALRELTKREKLGDQPKPCIRNPTTAMDSFEETYHVLKRPSNTRGTEDRPVTARRSVSRGRKASMSRSPTIRSACNSPRSASRSQRRIPSIDRAPWKPCTDPVGKAWEIYTKEDHVLAAL